MSKRKKIIVISVAVTLALVLGLGGLIYANNDHTEMGGHKLIGVGEMGSECYDCIPAPDHWWQHQEWDTQFIVTNPNCDKDLKIEWVALVASEDVYWNGDPPYWYAEDVIFEGTPQMWYAKYGIDIPGNEESERGWLSPHEVWQVSIAELIACVEEYSPGGVMDECDLSKYTLEVTWSGAYYSWWLGWGRVRPLIGWQKEKCWSYFQWGEDYPSFAISEAEMQLFPSKMPIKLPKI